MLLCYAVLNGRGSLLWWVIWLLAMRTHLPPPPKNKPAEMRGADYTAQPPRQLAEQLAQAQTRGGRQLGYVVVTRPVRQGRLRLALEEVLSMQLEAEGYGDSAAAAAAVGSRSLPPVAEREELALPGGGPLAPPSRAGSAAAPLPGAPGDALNPAVLLGLVGSDPSSCDDASRWAPRTSSSSPAVLFFGCPGFRGPFGCMARPLASACFDRLNQGTSCPSAHPSSPPPAHTYTHATHPPHPPSHDHACSLGSRASSSSNLRCAGSALIRAAASYTHLEAVAAAAAAPLRLLLAEDNAINMKVRVAPYWG
jgi:hypothetical protein